MTLAVKACTRSVLTFVQFTIIAALVVSLALIAVLSCLGLRKRSRTCEIPNALFDRLKESRGLTAQ